MCPLRKKIGDIADMGDIADIAIVLALLTIKYTKIPVLWKCIIISCSEMYIPNFSDWILFKNPQTSLISAD